jgi:hypothetical protein
MMSVLGIRFLSLGIMSSDMSIVCHRRKSSVRAGLPGVFQWMRRRVLNCLRINSSFQRELLSRKSLYGEVFGSLNDF